MSDAVARIGLHANNLWTAFTKQRVSAKGRAGIYRALSSMLKSGVLLREALWKLYVIYSDNGKKPKRSTAMMVREVYDNVDDGKTFGYAIRNWVGPEERQLIEAGEEAGELEGAFVDAMRLIEMRRAIASVVAAGVAYPTLLMISLVMVLKIVTERVVPAFEHTAPAETWQGAGRLLYFMAYGVDHFGKAAAVVFGTVIVGSLASLPYLTGNNRHRVERIVPWSIYRRIQGALFMMSVAVQIGNGVLLKDALKSIMQHATPYLKERVSPVYYSVVQGVTLGASLKDSGYVFPDRATIEMLTAIDGLEGFDKALRNLAEEEMASVHTTVKVAMAIFPIVMIVLNGLVLALVTLGGFAIEDSIGNQF